jgi:vitamin B12 transporter
MELEFTYDITKNTIVKAFYTYVTGKVTTKTGTGKDSTYFNLIRLPKNSFGLNISHRVNKQFFISSNLAAFGKRNDRYFDPQTFQTVKTVLKSYALWDIYAEYSFLKNKIRFFVDFRNILDSEYTEVSGFNTLGFNCNAGMRFNF